MTENGNMYMPVGPVGYGNGDGMFGSNGAWWIIILLAVLGWGNGFGGGFGNNNGGGFLGADVQRGFDQSAVITGINGVQNAVTAGFAGIEASANARQIADMNQIFTLQSSMQNCCCENRAATADLKYTIASEACNNRQALADSTQKILDQMCQDKIDAKNETIAMLRQQLQMAELVSSQTAQTAQLMAHNEAQTTALERYLAPVPIPAYVVANPNACSCGQAWSCNAA